MTLRQLTWMYEGHEADAFATHTLLAGVFNRLGDGKGEPLKIKPPAWFNRREVAATKDELDLCRAAFKEFVGARAGDGGA